MTAPSIAYQRFVGSHGQQRTPDVGSIDQRLSQSATLRAPPYFGQSASSGTSHLTPNIPSGYAPSFSGYQANLPSLSSNQQSDASIARSASSNILSTSPSLSSTFSDLRLNLLPPRQSFPNAPARPEVTTIKKSVDPRSKQAPSSLVHPLPARPQHKRSNAVQMPNLPPPSSVRRLEPRCDFAAHPPRGFGPTSPPVQSTPVLSLPSETPGIFLRDGAHRWFRVSEVSMATPISQIVLLFSASISLSIPTAYANQDTGCSDC